MTEHGALTFSDPDDYAGTFGDARVDITITGAGDFEARMMRFKLKDLELYLCCENLPRIAFLSLSPRQLFLSFPLGSTSLVSDGFALRYGDIVLHGPGENAHQRLKGACRWGLISLTREPFENCYKALTGQTLTAPRAGGVFRPARAEALRFQRLIAYAWRLAETAPHKLIDRPKVARALEQQLLPAAIDCLAGKEIDESSKTRRHRGAVMVRFENILCKRIDQKLNVTAICAEIDVPERTLRMYCAEFLGIGPRRYLMLRRLNKARAALRRADPSKATVAEIARNHQFREPGRFSVMYRAAFGESPSVTLQRDRHT